MSKRPGASLPKLVSQPRFEFGFGYQDVVMTPERHQQFVAGFIEPFVRAAHERVGGDVTLFSVACGDLGIADVLNPEDYRVRFVGLDLATPSSERLNALSAVWDTIDGLHMEYILSETALNMFIVGDVNYFNSVHAPVSADVAMGINAVIYEPRAMLEALFNALKPGGQAIVNYSLLSDPSNLQLLNLLRHVMGVTVVQESDFDAVDFSTVTDERLAVVRPYGVQRQPRNLDVLENLAAQVGFVDVQQFDFFPLVAPFNAILTLGERAEYGVEVPGFDEKQVVNQTRVMVLTKGS